MLSRQLPAAALALGLLAAAVPAAAAPPGSGEVFLVQGIVGSTWSFSIDGDVVEKGVRARQVLGGFDLDPGSHRVTARSDDGTMVEADLDVASGESQDVVLHLPVDASQDAVLTSFVIDRSPVPDGNTRLSVAHTAAVGPADIKVDGKVLFADVASGEQLTVVVPADTYRVAVVPAATDDPPVLGPLDLAVPAAKAMRVYAIGVAETGTMAAVVHTLSVPVTGSAEAPGGVPGGTGGQHAPPGGGPGSAVLAWAGVVALAGALLVGWSGVGRRGATGGA